MIPVEREDIGDISVLIINGELDFENTVWLRGELHDLLKQDRIKIILDLSGVEIISSYTVGVFVAFTRDSRDRGGDLKFLKLQRRVMQTFEATRINQILETFDEKDKALEAFSKTS